MKEALVSPDLTVSIVDSLIPEPNKNEVLIKVAVAGSNPKDWKMPSYGNLTLNSGDDISGWVEKVGADVVEFKKGDRVAAMHVMRASGGAFAECAVAPASTTFHLPESISFEEVSSRSTIEIQASLLIRKYIGCNHTTSRSDRRRCSVLESEATISMGGCPNETTIDHLRRIQCHRSLCNQARRSIQHPPFGRGSRQKSRFRQISHR